MRSEEGEIEGEKRCGNNTKKEKKNNPGVKEMKREREEGSGVAFHRSAL